MSSAVALANLDIFDREELNQHVLGQRGRVPRRRWRSCSTCRCVGDVRGDGYFYGIELVKDKDTTRDLRRRRVASGCCAGSCPRPSSTPASYCRADDRGDPVIQLAPPLICDQSHFDEIEQILRSVLTDAYRVL